MAEAQEKKDVIKVGSVELEISDKVAQDLKKAKIGIYTRPSTSTPTSLVCLLSMTDVAETVKDKLEHPKWAKKVKMHQSGSIDNKKEAMMVGGKIKLLVGEHANVALATGNIKKNEPAVKDLQDKNRFLLAYETELEGKKTTKEWDEIKRCTNIPGMLTAPINEEVARKINEMQGEGE